MSAIFLFLAILFTALYCIFEYKYKDRIYPGVFIGNQNVGGYLQEKLNILFNQRINLIDQQGITFTYHNQKTILLPLITTVDGDIVKQLIDFNIQKNIKEAYSFGRGHGFMINTFQKIHALIKKQHFEIYFAINDPEINNFLKEKFSHFETPAQNAKITYDKKKYYSNYNFAVKKEIYGQVINYQKGIKELKNNLASFSTQDIMLEATIDFPQIYAKDAVNIEAKAKKIMNNLPITVKTVDKTWTLKQNDVIDWLTLKNNIAKNSKDKIMVGIDFATATQYFIDNISLDIDQKPVDAKFEVTNGKVAEFQASKDGKKLNIIKSLALIERALTGGKKNPVELVVEVVKSQTKTKDINNLGIKEIIGTGHSNFSGSPRNRRHNIAVGAAAVNGTLIKPGDEFSLNTVLGEVDKAAGYLPELVIKDNKTIPEYGGGLCQIGTTVFRGTIASGLPVTMRRNHSYRVSYYEPAGTDATIYSPWPDYRFLNDTAKYILIQSRIEGNDLYFDFWGTKDGRIATSTYPTIYNYVKPGPAKIVETLDLEPGVKKCTEHAHSGVDAYFDYTVTYPNEEIKKVRFKSHYVPWRAVCLLGVKELSSGKKASSTNESVSNEN